MSKWIVDIHGDIEGDYEIIGEYKEQETEELVLAHVVDILIDLLVDRGYLYEAEREYFDAYYLDGLLGKRDEEDE